MRRSTLHPPPLRVGLVLLALAGACSTRATPTSDPLCAGATAVSLETIYARYFDAAPSSGVGGCARVGCHGDGAGGLLFRSTSELYAAAANTTSPGAGRPYIVPERPSDSYFYQRMTAASTGQRMPPGGPFLSAAQLAEVAGWICAGAAPPQGGGPMDAGVDAAQGTPDAATSDAAMDMATSDAAEGCRSVSFSAEVQPIFNSRCTSCHSGTNPAAGLSLAPGAAYAQLVDMPASCGGRVLVTPSLVSQSYLVDKLTGTNLCSGTRMPPPPSSLLPQAQIDTIRNWICSGAQNN